MRRTLIALAVLLTACSHAAAAAGSPHVVHPRGTAPYIADVHGRMLLLRGVAVTSLIQYNTDFQETVPAHPGDFAEMRALGFNVVRLPVSWSRIEPAPGRFDSAYLRQIRQIVSWAQRDGMYVWVDMHQDRYNRHTWPRQEVDGAPDWATLTYGAPCTSFQASTLCAQTATENFWQDTKVDGRGLQEWYLGALLELSRSLRFDQRLLGLELMNEPTPGTVTPPAFERTQLWPFYLKMIAGLRGDGERRVIWFEPNSLRDLFDRDTGDPQQFSSDPNLVYAPHVYAEVFSEPPQPVGAPGPIQHSWTAAASEANSYGAPLFDGEYGGGTNGPGGTWDQWLTDNLDEQDQHLAGSAFWMWKQQPGFYNWQTVNKDGSLRTDSLRAQLLSRPHPDAVPGTLRSIRYTTGHLKVTVSGPGGVADIWGGTVVVHGGKTLIFAPLTRVLSGHRQLKTHIVCRRFRTSKVWLSGAQISVRIPRGTQTLTFSEPERRGVRCVP